MRQQRAEREKRSLSALERDHEGPAEPAGKGRGARAKGKAAGEGAKQQQQEEDDIAAQVGGGSVAAVSGER